MRVLVWGLGYVGTVSAACLAELGHQVIGIDPDLVKVEAINGGRTAVKEQGLGDLVKKVVEKGQLKAIANSSSLVFDADISLICVGTPSNPDGSPVLTYIERVAADIGRRLHDGTSYHVILLRSTVFPGVARNLLCPLLEKYSGKQAGKDFGVVVNPEFLREASAIADFYSPPYTVIGELDVYSGDLAKSLYQSIRAKIYRVTLEEAEILKLTCNAFHGLKIGFANEVGRLCDPLKIDGYRIMEIVCEDTKLNISKSYLRPGFAFGGSCLPKDLRSLTFNARHRGVDLPILESVLPSNDLHIEFARIKIHKLNLNCVGFLGLSFKPGTDDMRESPTISLIRALWQDGIDILVYDPDVDLSTMLGSNLEYLKRQLPQISQILKVNVHDIFDQCQAIVITQHRSDFIQILQIHNKVPVIDLVGLRP